MEIETDRRALTETKTSRQMTFDRSCLNKINFNSGNYNVIYHPEMIIITKNPAKIIEFLNKLE